MKMRIPDVSAGVRSRSTPAYLEHAQLCTQRARLREMAQKNVALRLAFRKASWADVLRGDDVIPLLRVCRADPSQPWAYASTGRFFADAVLASTRYLQVSKRAGRDDGVARLGAIWSDRGAPSLIVTIIIRAAIARFHTLRTQ